MTNALRQKLIGLSDSDLALLVKVAFESINDLIARTMIADIVDLSGDQLVAFGENVIEPLVTDAETALGWYDEVQPIVGERVHLNDHEAGFPAGDYIVDRNTL